jgi:peptide/nickel transport system substrate-binding protein
MTYGRVTRRDFVRGAAAAGAALTAGPWLAETAQGAPAPVRGGRLTVGVQADIPHLDPHRSGLTISYVCLSPMYQGLTELGPNLELRPQLATSWNVSPDGLSWTFALRRGVRFHNGRTLTSRDVRFSVERILDPKTGARGRGDLSSIASIDTPNPTTVVFRLKSPFGFFPNKLATSYQAILPPEAVDAGNNVTKPIGTGAFQFGEWVTNDHLTMRRFDGYWDAGKPYVDEVMLKPIPDETVRLTALQTGDVAIVDSVPQARLQALFAQPSRDYVIRLVRGGGGQGVIVLNTRHKPFDNAGVRRAVAYALNKREMVDAQYRGWGVTDNQNFSPTSPWYLPVKDRPYDVARAKSLLAEAGMPNGFKITMQIANGYGFPEVAQVFQAQMRRIGVDVAIQVYDVPTWANRINTGNYDIDLTGFFAKVDPDDAYYRYSHSNGGVWQLSGYLADAELDRLLDEGRTEADVAKAKATYTRVVEILQDQASMLIFGSGHSASGWRTNVQGYAPQLIGALAYAGGGVQEAWLTK